MTKSERAAGRAERVTLEDIPVMLASEKGAPDEAGPRAFARLEAALPSLRARRFYGYFHPPTGEYRACVALRESDDPDALGLSRGVIAGGAYLRERLRGDPGEVYPRIGPTFDRLAAEAGTPDRSRPWLEHYRRRDEVDVLVPIAG